MTVTNLNTVRVNDPVLTGYVHTYCQANSIAPFVAPVVPVPVRAGKVVKHTKEQFAVINTRRAPGMPIQRRKTGFGIDNYYLEQHAAAGEVTFEEAEEALNGEARIDLRRNAVALAASTVAQSWEKEVVDTITNASLYESTNLATLAGADRFDTSTSDPEAAVQEWKEAIRAQIGCYPNSMIIDTATYNALKFHPIFRDRVKYTSSASINLAMLATWFDLPRGLMVAQRVYLDPVTGLLQDFMPKGSSILFFAPEGPQASDANSATFLPLDYADKGMPSAFYTYQLRGYPVVEAERIDQDRKVFVNDVIAEQSVIPVGLGATGKIGAAFYANGLVS